MPEHARQFEHSVLHRLRRLSRRLRAYVMLDGLAVVLTVGLGLAAVQLLIDWSLRLRTDMRAALLVAVLAGVGVVLWRRVISPLRRGYGVYEAACLIEQRHPELQSLLVSGLQFHSGGGAPAVASAGRTNSPQLVRAVIDQSARRVEGLPLDGILNHSRAKRSGLLGLGVLAFVAVAYVVNQDLISRWFQRNVLLTDIDWPQRTRLSVDVKGNTLTAARGDDLEIRALAEGDVPRQVEILFAVPDGKTGREPMIAVGERGFRYTFARVENEFTFSLRGGDDRTRDYHVKLVDRPRVETSVMGITPPKYAGTETVMLPEGQRASEVLPGSEVRIVFHTNKPVVDAVLRAGERTIGEAVSMHSGVASHPDGTLDAAFTHGGVSFRPTETQSYRLELVDADGLEDKRPARFSVRVVKDEPPRVRMKLAGVGDMVTSEAVLPIDVEVGDTYGLASADFVYQFPTRAASVAGSERDTAEPTRSRLPDFEPGLSVFNTRFDWRVSEAGVVPGDRLTIYAEAADANDVSGPGIGKSSGATLRVVTRDELLAELARREQEFRQNFEKLIEAQEQLRNELLTNLGRLDDAVFMTEFDRIMAGHERRQRQIAGQLNVIRQQFEQILTEMRVNQLDSAIVQERLGRGVIEPMGDLARREMISAADLLRRLAAEPSPGVASTVDPLQAEIVKQMRIILAQMLKWEGFQETVSMLREILRMQGELNDETLKAIERQAEAIFEE